MCSDRDIFADDPLTGSQLLAFVNAPTLVDTVVPARSSETEKALQPVLNLNQVVEYQPERNTVWTESKVFGKLFNLKIIPEQQSSVESGIWIDQWALGKSQAWQLFKDLQRQLIFFIHVQRQAALGEDHKMVEKNSLQLEFQEINISLYDKVSLTVSHFS